MGTAAVVMSGMAEKLNDLAIAAHDNPVTAVTAGIATAVGALGVAGRLSYSLLNGFGNATFGPAAGEMLAAGHEQVTAGRMFLTAAEMSRAGALEHDLPGVVPGGKAGMRAAEKEGVVLAEGAAEAAIGSKIIGAIEGGLKGGLTVEAMEIAAAAGVTLTAGSVAFLGLSAAAIMAALVHSTGPKHRAVDDPNYNKPLAPNGFDINAPHLQEASDDAKKFWFNRGVGRPRGAEPGHQDTGKRGHWAYGRGGTAPHWVVEEAPRPLANAPFFSVAPLGPDGRPTVAMPHGMDTEPDGSLVHGPRSGQACQRRIPELYSLANVPLPFPVPGRAFAEGRTKDDLTPLSRGGAVPVTIVGSPPALARRLARGRSPGHRGTLPARRRDVPPGPRGHDRADT